MEQKHQPWSPESSSRKRPNRSDFSNRFQLESHARWSPSDKCCHPGELISSSATHSAACVRLIRTVGMFLPAGEA